MIFCKQQFNINTSLRRINLNDPIKDISANEKRKLTVMTKYGVENISHLPEIIQKQKDSNFIKYGFENVNQVEEFRKKARTTNLLKYGKEYPSHTEKCIETSLKRYGVRHPMQNVHVFNRVMKARYKIKTIKTKTGKEIKYQGYEDVIIKFLLDMGIDEDLIITNRSHIPKIFYNNPISKKTSRYYPDIWIAGTKLLIEVKSKFTLKFNLEVTLEKQSECKRQCFHCIIIVCSKTGILEIIK